KTRQSQLAMCINIPWGLIVCFIAIVDYSALRLVDTLRTDYYQDVVALSSVVQALKLQFLVAC
ncbi:MAG: hypothetical protein EB059_11455, partial [Alphaproteobacteria bacterium]|nr:hypothetical protein [Alphaproteobacteria bacterium]